jgi:hypothetical protein
MHSTILDIDLGAWWLSSTMILNNTPCCVTRLEKVLLTKQRVGVWMLGSSISVMTSWSPCRNTDVSPPCSHSYSICNLYPFITMPCVCIYICVYVCKWVSEWYERVRENAYETSIDQKVLNRVSYCVIWNSSRFHISTESTSGIIRRSKRCTLMQVKLTLMCHSQWHFRRRRIQGRRLSSELKSTNSLSGWGDRALMYTRINRYREN